MRAVAGKIDVRYHLATKSPYSFRRLLPGSPSLYETPDPAGYQPSHLWLLSRHGTRWPTKDRMQQMDKLEATFKDARAINTYPWLQNWTSPFRHHPYAAGELHPIGEEELWSLAGRLRRRFPGLMRPRYYPKRYPIISTQVARTAQSASAFASGFFLQTPAVQTELTDARMARALQAASKQNNRHVIQPNGRGGSGSGSSSRWRPQPVAISMAPKRRDPVLRFFNMCPAYEKHEAEVEMWLASWMMGNWSMIASRMERRLNMKGGMDPCDVDGVWQLCQYEAGILGQTDRACALLDPSEILLLEWMDDVRLYEAQGYGAPVNYEIAAPLLADLAVSLRAAAGSESESVQLGRLLFAHCETIVPLASLMGLFQPSAAEAADLPRQPAALEFGFTAEEVEEDAEAVDASEDLQLRLLGTKIHHHKKHRHCYKGRPLTGTPTAPPPEWQPITTDDDRTWRAAKVAPHAANMAVVLYRAAPSDTGNNGTGRGGAGPRHKVRVVYNEQVVQLPGCSSLDCDLDEFLDRVVGDKAAPDKLSRACGLHGADALDTLGLGSAMYE